MPGRALPACRQAESRPFSLLFILFFTILLTSCRKEELPVQPLDRGSVVTAQVDMGNDYKQQIYYSLGNNSIVSTNLKVDWDLAFESSATGTHIKLNSAKWMGIYKTQQTVFSTVTDTSGYANNTMYDAPSGNMDSTAVGSWQDGKVYVLFRGYTPSGSKIGFKKIQFISSDASTYTFKYANLNGSSEQTITLTKQSSKNFTCFSINTNAVANIEPDKENFDLWFTQFTHVYADHTPYLVVGILSNPHKVKTSRITDISFDNIKLNDTITHPFTPHVNNIGFDWKTFSLNTNTYTVDPSMCFIIKATDGFYYKLHFIGFYNSGGLKGSPKFEFKKL
ncbi:MAG TPA: HmuY family protein [Bacteroidia bacterium]